ncbi:protein translocase subunit SecF [Spirochaeta africana]|uniref:Protein-export membrane protein SecF n=1 Tax=Spirochaeta africana (strain ATCC 700263 / DSM 8902 / Z-7692) TaxID=889378 RepID=H9UFL9_SPIAZ|nr:protein translocase subunit SecF [Spirochaeta africana]AFG36312.1 protein-export membrane protein, SecD/SecF family [Spirochaeta africana DSM 8902]
MKRAIPFTKYRFAALVFSLLVITAGIAMTVSQGGFNLGIDFQPGLRMQVQLDGQNVTPEEVSAAVRSLTDIQAVQVGDPADQSFMVRVQDDGDIADFSVVTAEQLLDLLKAAFGEVEVQETAYVGPRFSQDLTGNAIWLLIGVFGLILAYIWFRFRLTYAASAIVTLVHDVIVMLGVIGAFQLEVTTATIAAVLTIIGYSLNDTIVIFDRIRENETLLREAPHTQVIDTSITQSLTRTIITSVTTLLAVGAIYVFAVGEIQLFALNLMVGIVVGTYSSIFVASPALLVFTKQKKKRRAKKAVQDGDAPAAAAPAKAGSKTANEVSFAEKKAMIEQMAQKRSANKAGTGKPKKGKKK